MDIRKIIEVGEACYQTYPCLHDCRVQLEDGNIIERRLGARFIIQFWDDLDYDTQTHLSKYTARPVKAPEIFLQSYDEYNQRKQQLIEKFRAGHSEQLERAWQEATAVIASSNITERLDRAFSNGYTGFILHVDSFLDNLSEQRKKDLDKIFRQKLRDEGLIYSETDKIVDFFVNGSGALIVMMPTQIFAQVAPKGSNLMIHEPPQE